MAFEAYLAQTAAPPSRGRRMIYVVSIALHAVAVLCAIAYSFWHVEELVPPSVTVTFVSAAAAPPPPPPPPPLGGGAGSRKKSVPHPKIEVTPKTPELVQPKVEVPKETPKETPKEAPKDEAKPESASPPGPGTADGVKGGVAGGVKGGVVGGVVGGAVKAQAPLPMAPKFLPPQMGKQQKLSGADPEMPTFLARAGANFLVMAKICVSGTGSVDNVTLLKRAHPTLDANVLSAVKTWRFRPLMANGTPVPFCYFGNFEFKSE